jgi:hypothetical protein
MGRLSDAIRAWLYLAPTPDPIEHPAPPATPVTAPKLVDDNRDEYELLETLIARLERSPVLTAAQESALWDKFREEKIDWIGMALEGKTYNQATGGMEIYNQPEADFKAEIRRTDNDLKVQIDRFNVGLDRWFEIGETHPPYFPERIAIILSKRKELERERRFLAAYSRHFAKPTGYKNKVVLRAEKKGAFDPFNP